MRYYVIETDDRLAVHITSEHIGYTEAGAEAVMMDSGGFTVGSDQARVWTAKELRSLPGGAEALQRWNAGADEAYQAWQDRESVLNDADEALSDPRREEI